MRSGPYRWQRLAPAVLASVLAACLLPGEPSAEDQVEFRFNFPTPLRVPVAARTAPAIQILVNGEVMRGAAYRLESDSVVEVAAGDSGRVALVGIARGLAAVRVVYLGTTGSPDTTFDVRGVVASVVVTPQPDSQPPFRRLGQTQQLTAHALNADGYQIPIAGASFTWRSDLPGVASVSPSGLVTAVNEGTATIAAEVDSVSGTSTVIVTQSAAARVVLAPELDTLRTLGRRKQFEAVVFDSTNAVLRPAKVWWSSSDNAVATVDSTGVATALRSGTTQIVGRVGRAADTARLAVAQVVRLLFVSPSFVTFQAIDDTIRVMATATDSSGQPVIPGPVVAWSSADTTIAKVDQTGLIRAARSGDVVITASSGSQSAFVTVIVRPRVASLRFADDTVALVGEGDTSRLAVVALDKNGYPVDRPRLTWKSGLAVVASVDSTGLATAHGDGATVVAATSADPGVTATDSVTVTVTGTPARELMAFQSRLGIEVMRTDGSLRSTLIPTRQAVCEDYYYGPYACSVFVWHPAWSPSGDRLAYTRSNPVDGGTDVYVSGPDGSDTVNITGAPGWDGKAAWSPDGARIAFVTDRVSNTSFSCCFIDVVNADGSNRRRLMSNRGTSPTWSADGTRIAFERDGDIYVVNADGAGEMKVTSKQAFLRYTTVAWSPDGSKLAVQTTSPQSPSGLEGDIWIMNPDGSQTVNLTAGVRPQSADDVLPAWSPDGSRIVFASAIVRSCDDYSGCDRDPYHLYSISRDGTGLRQLTTGGADEWTSSWRRAAGLHAAPAILGRAP